MGKAALVCGHFYPELGYLESQLADAMVRMGYTVKVFSSDHVPTYLASAAKRDRTGMDPFDVERIPHTWSKGQMVEVKGLTERINEFDPELVVTIGVGKLFPRPVYADWERNYRVITFFGDNSDNAATAGSKANGLTRWLNKRKWKTLRTLYKNPAYKLAVMGSDQLVGYTPETLGILEEYMPELKKKIRSKYTEISLGFSPDDFSFNAELRQKKRALLGIKPNEKLVVTATRIVPHKKLEHILYTCEDLEADSWKYAICGMDDGEYSQWLRARVKEYELEDKVIFLPFLSNQELNDIYNAADIGVWYHPTIAALSAMGTGLPVVLQERKKISHLTDEELVTVFNNDLLGAIQKLVATKLDDTERMVLANQVKAKYSYEAILSDVFESVSA